MEATAWRKKSYIGNQTAPDLNPSPAPFLVEQRWALPPQAMDFLGMMYVGQFLPQYVCKLHVSAGLFGLAHSVSFLRHQVQRIAL